MQCAQNENNHVGVVYKPCFLDNVFLTVKGLQKLVGTFFWGEKQRRRQEVMGGRSQMKVSSWYWHVNLFLSLNPCMLMVLLLICSNVNLECSNFGSEFWFFKGFLWSHTPSAIFTFLVGYGKCLKVNGKPCSWILWWKLLIHLFSTFETLMPVWQTLPIVPPHL